MDTYIADLKKYTYEALRKHRVESSNRTITYQDLIKMMPRNYEKLSPNDRQFHDVLGDIVLDCRELGLPALPAMVVNQFSQRPGKGYWEMAYPRTTDPAILEANWNREIQLISTASYPYTLDKDEQS